MKTAIYPHQHQPMLGLLPGYSYCVRLKRGAMGIQIDGLNELSNVLTTLTPKAAKRYLSRCAEPAAQVVLDAMAETVPSKVGILEESLGWQKHWSSDGDETTMDIEIGPLKPAFWGSFAEFGTATQPAQHWFGRAWEGCRDEVLNVFVTELTGLEMDLANKSS